MSVASMVGAWVRGKPAPVEVVERPVVLWEPDGTEEWTVEGTAQYMIAMGYDRADIAEFVRKNSK